jgi:glucose/arabinose dehydrogenase
VATRADLVALTLLVALAAAPRADAQAQLPTGFKDDLVVDGLSEPVGMAFLPDGRLLIVEQNTARILIHTGPPGTAAIEVATLTGVHANDGERGLLGIAVDPRWPTSPYLYVHATRTGNHVAISRYTATGDLAGTGGGGLAVDPATRYDLVADVPDNISNHNGGTVRFGLDGMLYASFGEDGVSCAAQDTVSLRGVILRLDVTRLPAGPGVAPRALVAAGGNPFAASPDSNARLVWEFGLRNPFRFQVDPASGDLWISDVGQSLWEELDRAGSGGLDFGWPFREGPVSQLGSCAGIVRPPLLVGPVFSYDRSAVGGGDAAIIAAGRYLTGPAARFPVAYWGNVFVSDYYAGHLWRLVGSGDSWSIAPAVSGQALGDQWGEGFDTVSDYCLGLDGWIYYCRMYETGFTGPGKIRRIRYVGGGLDTPPSPRPIAVLHSAYPQPARDHVRLEFALAQATEVAVTIHDLRGRRVRRLMQKVTLGPGTYTPTWDGLDDDRHRVESGLYFARFEAGGQSGEWRVVIAR